MNALRRGRLIAATLLAAGLLILGVLGPTRAQPVPGGAVPVSVVTVAARDVPVDLAAIGTVAAYRIATIRPRVDGTIVAVHFHEGQEVVAGTPLFDLDSAPFRAVLDQASAKKAQDEAQLANARRDLTRYQSLAARDFASRQQLDTQRALVATLNATLAGDNATIEAAKVNLAYTHITAPIAGRLGLRLVDLGNVVRAADTNNAMVTIAQLRPIAALFALPQDRLPAIRVAMTRGVVPVSAYAGGGTALLGQGRLLTLDNTIDATSGTIRMKAVFANTQERLWPGQFVKIVLHLATLRHVLAVPSAAVQRGPAGLFVYVIAAGNVAAVRKVTLTQDDGHVAVVASGLQAGMKVVTLGQSRLRPGLHVTVRAAASAS